VYEVEIQNGLDLLDEKLGRDVWIPRVDAAQIRMTNPFACVAAQAVGTNYGDAMIALGASHFDPVKYGFELLHDPSTTLITAIIANWTTLEREWQDTIAAMKFPD